MWKTCECFHKEAPIFIVTTLLKLPLWGLKSSLPPLESLLLSLISLGLLPVSQVFGNCLMFESFFVPNLWLLTFPFASFSPAQDPRSSPQHSSLFPIVCLHRTDFSVFNPQIPSPILYANSSCWMAPPYLAVQQMLIFILVHSTKLWVLTEHQKEGYQEDQATLAS